MNTETLKHQLGVSLGKMMLGCLAVVEGIIPVLLGLFLFSMTTIGIISIGWMASIFIPGLVDGIFTFFS